MVPDNLKDICLIAAIIFLIIGIFTHYIFSLIGVILFMIWMIQKARKPIENGKEI